MIDMNEQASDGPVRPDGPPAQVFIVTSGSYSDYRIDSVWLTREEAEAHAQGGGVEVYAIGNGQRTLGGFSRGIDLDGTTGRRMGKSFGLEGPDLEEARAEIICWHGQTKIGIRVHQETAERADKVLSETIAFVKAQIDLGLTPRQITSSEYRDGVWHDLKTDQRRRPT
jgi:hypothetical protein